jgi:pimeloyl-ACP methyl ester carboxylesterase
MAHGFSLTRHDGLPRFAEALAAVGATVLVFDHRGLGDSGGEPQRFRAREQVEDWRAACALVRGWDDVDPHRLVLWGYSFGGGHAVTVAAEQPQPAAVILLAPFLDGLARALATPPRTAAWLLPRAIADLAGAHVRVPVTGPPGSNGAMTLPGEADGFASAVPDGSPWRNEISPGVFATVAQHRPVRLARRLGMPVWIGAGDTDITVSRAAIDKLAARAPRAELHRYDGDHFDVLQGDLADRIAADQAVFLARPGILP